MNYATPEVQRISPPRLQRVETEVHVIEKDELSLSTILFISQKDFVATSMVASTTEI